MLRIIAAVAEDGSVGIDGGLPWRCREDLSLFRRKTMGDVIVAGRKTAQGLPGGLGGRECRMMTGSGAEVEGWRRIDIAGVLLTHLDSMQYHDLVAESDAWIIGGAQIYEIFLPVAEELHITRIPGMFWGDTFFPDVPEDRFVMREQELIAEKVQRLDGVWIDGDVFHEVWERR